ncbi:MAG: nucleotide exchange factor GrpE [Parachlamydiaceae bacterium]
MSDTIDPSEEIPIEGETAVESQENVASSAENELQELQNQVSDFREKYLRGLADSENMRKRLQKEKQDLAQYAIQGAIIDFLSPIDHLENALKFANEATPEVQHWAIGFQMILGQFKEALSNNGVNAFSSVGQPFDPHWHEAIEMVETEEYAPGTVVEESLRGYKMGEKVIRPARVKVAKSAPALSENESADIKTTGS